MANGHGGYRRPSNPAPTSGPGKLSRRTDGGPADQGQRIASGGGYGDRKDMEEIQSGAAMQGGGNPGGDMGLPAGGPAPVPLSADSQRPDEPVTAGAPVGAGIGPEAAGIASDQEAAAAQMRPLVTSLEYIANLPGSNPATRAFVRALKAQS